MISPKPRKILHKMKKTIAVFCMARAISSVINNYNNKTILLSLFIKKPTWLKLAFYWIKVNEKAESCIFNTRAKCAAIYYCTVLSSVGRNAFCTLYSIAPHRSFWWIMFYIGWLHHTVNECQGSLDKNIQTLFWDAIILTM